MTVACNGPDDDFTLITAAVAQWHDREWLRGTCPAGCARRPDARAVDCLIVTGPKARDLFAAISDADLTLPWLSTRLRRRGARGGARARLLRGRTRLGGPRPLDDIPAIYDAVLAGGAKPFGMWALNSLRLEKGYRAWKGDLSTDYTLLEGGLDRFIRFDKPQDFPGKAALLAEKQRGSRKRFAVLTVDAGEADAPYMSTIWHDGQVVGEVTSGGWGYRVGASIALAMLRPDLACPGTAVEVEIFGERRPALVRPLWATRPLWDPEERKAEG
jgi:dimethylglycine dehydrogenase